MSDAREETATNRPPTMDEKPPVSDVFWDYHARNNWFDRAKGGVILPETATEDDWASAWERAIPVDYPPAREPCTGYYHPEGDVVILARPDRDDPTVTAVVTVIALTDRPPEQQAYVREQARLIEQLGVDR